MIAPGLGDIGQDVVMVRSEIVRSMQNYDVAALRAQFPALAEGAAHFDGPGGSQVPDAGRPGGGRCAHLRRGQPRPDHRGRAPGRRLRDRRSGRAGRPARRRSARRRLRAEHDPADLRLRPDAGQDWGPGDEIVVTRLDHDANVRPWVQAARGGRGERSLGRLRPGDRRTDRRRRRRPCPSGPGWSRSPRPRT